MMSTCSMKKDVYNPPKVSKNTIVGQKMSKLLYDRENTIYVPTGDRMGIIYKAIGVDDIARL